MILLKRSSLAPFAIQLAFLLNQASADLVLDWHWYPSASQACLAGTQNTVQCPDGDVPSFNGCVCRNGNGFLQTAAQCLGSSDPNDLTAVYNVLVSNCGDSSTPVQIALSQWLSWATPPNTQKSTTSTPQSTPAAGPTATATATVTHQGIVSVTQQGSTITNSATATTSASPGILGGSISAPTSSGGGKSKLGTGAIIGLGLGIPACCALIGLLAVMLFRTRRRDPDDPQRVEGEVDPNDKFAAGGGEADQKFRDSIPSTVSPVLSNGTSRFSAGQGELRYPPPPQELGQHPYVGQTLYAAPPYQGGPVGQSFDPQFPARSHPYLAPTAPVPNMPYGGPGTYSELSALPGTPMPGAQVLVPQGGMTNYHELAVPS